MDKTTITIEATVNAAADTVWRCMTEPEHITQWNFASDDWCCPSAETDLNVGGQYRARMEAKDGSFGFDFEAVFDEIDEPRKLGYTLTDGRKVITEFEPQGDATRVVTVFDAETQNSADMQRNGWQAILDNFKRYVESGQG
jgi:uncharacterized protein YndB with AHSA1/START domain